MSKHTLIGVAVLGGALVASGAVPALAAQNSPASATFRSCPSGQAVSIQSRSSGNTNHYHNTTVRSFQNGTSLIYRYSGIGLTQENWQVYSSDIIDTAHTFSYCTG